jgi:hypothetical protein
MAVERQVELQVAWDEASAAAPSGLSAVGRDGQWLWLAGDEEPCIERLHLTCR